MLFSILFTYPKSENQNLVLACNEGKQCALKYFVMPLSPLAIIFDFVSCFRCSFASFRIVKQFGIWRWKANEKTNLMIQKHLKT